jgi:hypothetical protein
MEALQLLEATVGRTGIDQFCRFTVTPLVRAGLPASRHPDGEPEGVDYSDFIDALYVGSGA